MPRTVITNSTKSRLTKGGRNWLIGISGFLLVGIIVSAGTIMYARGHGGQINVSATIAASNQEFNEREAATGGDGSAALRPNTNTTSQQPNGGLVGTGKTPKPTPPPPQTDETATTSPASEDDESNADVVDAEEHHGEGEASDVPDDAAVQEEAGVEDADAPPVAEGESEASTDTDESDEQPLEEESESL